MSTFLKGKHQINIFFKFLQQGNFTFFLQTEYMISKASINVT